jgi:hypothetical protein
MSRAISYVDRTLRLVFSLGVIVLLTTYWSQTNGLAMFGLALLLTGLGLLAMRNLRSSGLRAQYGIEQLSCASAAALLICAGVARIENADRTLLDAVLIIGFVGSFVRAVMIERMLRRDAFPKSRESGLAYARRTMRQAKDLWS